MNPVLIKSLMGIGAAGATIVGGYGIYSHLTSPHTLGDLLISQGFTLLDVDGASDDTHWNKNVNDHKDSSSSGRAPKLSGYSEDTTESDTNQQATNNRNKMKIFCKHLFRLSSSETSKLEEAKQWCTKSKTSST